MVDDRDFKPSSIDLMAAVDVEVESLVEVGILVSFRDNPGVLILIREMKLHIRIHLEGKRLVG